MSEKVRVPVSEKASRLLSKLKEDDESFSDVIERIAEQALEQQKTAEERERRVTEKQDELRQKMLNSPENDSEPSGEPQTDVEEARQSVRDRLDLPRGDN